MRAKKIALAFVVVLLAVGIYQPAMGAEIGLGVNIDIPAFTFHRPPVLAVIPGTYAYYVPDIDEDIFFYEGLWYRPWRGRWYWAEDYNGPWIIGRPGLDAPEPLLYLRPAWRRNIVVYEKLPYDYFIRNWRAWGRDRYWENRYEWWREGRHEREREFKEHRNYWDRDRDRKDMDHDRRDMDRDRRDMDHDRRDMDRDHRDTDREYKEEKSDTKKQLKQTRPEDEKEQKQEGQEGEYKGLEEKGRR